MESSNEFNFEGRGDHPIFSMEYGPLIRILSFLDVKEVVEKRLVSKSFNRNSYLALDRPWSLTEMYEFNYYNVRKNFQKYSVIDPMKVRLFDKKVQRKFGESLKKVQVFYEDNVSSDRQKRMLPLYVNQHNVLSTVKFLFVLVYGNYPVRSGSEINADLYNKRHQCRMPYSSTDIGSYADYFLSSAKWGEELKFTHHYLGEKFDDDTEMKEIMEYPIVDCCVKSIVKWGQMYHYGPTYKKSYCGSYNQKGEEKLNFYEMFHGKKSHVVNRSDVMRKIENRELFVHYLETLELPKDWEIGVHNSGRNIGEPYGFWEVNLDVESLYSVRKNDPREFRELYSILRNRPFHLHRAMG